MDINPAVPAAQLADDKGVEVKDAFLQFLEEWKITVENNTVNPYLEQLKEMLEHEETTLFVNFEHLMDFSEALASLLQQDFYRFDPFIRESLRNFVQKAVDNNLVAVEQNPNMEYIVAFHSMPTVQSIRDLKTDLVGKLVSIRGTVVRTSAVHPELVRGTFMCMDCSTIIPDVEQQFRFTEPVRCKNPNCDNRQRFKLLVESSKFVDFQKVRIQESSDEIPSGSMPRSIDIILRHQAVEKAKAGDKAVFTGNLIVVPDVAQLSGSAGRTAIMGGGSRDGYSEEGVTGLKALGVRDLTYKLAFLGTTVQPRDVKFGVVNVRDDEATMQSVLNEFTQEQRNKILSMRHDPELYRKLTDSITPTVFGHEEVKRGVLLMLFGGVHKSTLDGINLRGDINVCIVGDPSTAKSQFLKYVSEFVPRSVYTSGKASSAAGLTAAVIKDEDTNEFYIEAGALMLADNGICCIDEFDKMDQRDQVAIHEAMEQQTISITKAGIQATLNARTSVLAAANPINGRYDKSKTLRSNVAMTSPIMSRFDLFFVIVDECDEVTDYNIARHITNMHQRLDDAVAADYTTDDLQRYIKFARTLKPKITEDAKAVMITEYRKLREGDMTSNKSSYRITVRQLESMVRLSEALARLHCQTEVTASHVGEACRLLRKSIIHVESEDVALSDLGTTDAGLQRPLAPTDGSETDTSMPALPQEAQEESTVREAQQPKRVSYEKYMRITYEIVHFIRQKEVEADTPETFEGVSRASVIQWYLKEHEAEFDTMEAAAEETEILRLIIARMISTDNVILQIDADRSTEDEEAMLAVHPNYNPE